MRIDHVPYMRFEGRPAKKAVYNSVEVYRYGGVFLPARFINNDAGLLLIRLSLDDLSEIITHDLDSEIAFRTFSIHGDYCYSQSFWEAGLSLHYVQRDLYTLKKIGEYEEGGSTGGPKPAYKNGYLFLRASSLHPDGDAVIKINASTMEYTGEYSSYVATVTAIIIGDDGYLYFGGNSTFGNSDGDVRKVDPDDMSTVVGSYNDFGGERIRSLAFAGGFLFVAEDGNRVHKIDPSTMTVAEDGVGNPLIYDDAYESVTVAAGDDGYIYVGTVEGRVQKIDPADMTLVAENTDHTSLPTIKDGGAGFLYSAGYDGRALKINKTTMATDATYATHAGNIGFQDIEVL